MASLSSNLPIRGIAARAFLRYWLRLSCRPYETLRFSRQAREIRADMRLVLGKYEHLTSSPLLMTAAIRLRFDQIKHCSIMSYEFKEKSREI